MGSGCSAPTPQLGHVMTEEEMLATCLRYEEMARKDISENGILTGERYKDGNENGNGNEKKKKSAMFKFLQNLNLEQHYSGLMKDGWTTMERLRLIDDRDELKSAGSL